MNVVMTGQGQLVEIQGTAESKSFSRVQLLAMLDIAEDACQHLVAEQAKIIGDFFPPPSQAKR
jgi:ribonuclease PH